MVCLFVRNVGLDILYAYGSIVNVIVPSLKRLEKDFTEAEEIPREIHLAINAACRDVRRSVTHRAGVEGKQPAIMEDVVRVIEITPALLPSKAEESSLWLIAVSTGARALTCDNVLLGDIVSVTQCPGTQKVIVSLRYRVTKGNRNWGQIVNVEGKIGIYSSTDCVYWLDKHLKKNFNLNILNLDNWDPQIGGTKLWRWSKDCMRELFKDRMERC